MSTETSSSKQSLIVKAAIGVGVISAMYFLYKKFVNNKEDDDDDLKNLTNQNDNSIQSKATKSLLVDNLANKSNHTIEKSRDKILEVTTSINFELSTKKGENAISKQENITFNKDNSTSTKNSYTQIPKLVFANKTDVSGVMDKGFNETPNVKFKEFKDEVNDDIKSPDRTKEMGKIVKSKRTPPSSNRKRRNSTDEKVEKMDLKDKEKVNQHHLPTIRESVHYNSNQDDFSFANLLQDLKHVDTSRLGTKENNISLSLDYNHLDFRKIDGNNNIFNSDGYIEEEDFDQFTPEDEEVQKIGTESENILTVEQLERILYNNKYENQSFKISLSQVEIKGEKKGIIKDDFMITILKYLFTELNEAMLELSDNCAEDRRKFFENNQANYIKTIELYIKRKNEFFSCVLSNLFLKLSIKQQDFDNSINYYIDEAPETERVSQIKAEYEKVYKVGKKEIKLIPRYLNRSKLKEILQFKCKAYESTISQYSELSIEMIKIIVNDHVYAEYGLEKEIVEKAMETYNVYDDNSFKPILDALDTYQNQNDSFLNI